MRKSTNKEKQAEAEAGIRVALVLVGVGTMLMFVGGEKVGSAIVLLGGIIGLASAIVYVVAILTDD